MPVVCGKGDVGSLSRVVAGPGSGKTRVLAARAADLVVSRGVQPWQIMALTFTNKVCATTDRARCVRIHLQNRTCAKSHRSTTV